MTSDERSATLIPPSVRLLTPEAVRRLELHEARAHAHGIRAVRDLGDAILLYDPTERDPFLNRMSGLRLPRDLDRFARRLTELYGLFASLDRLPHVRLSPRFHTPLDLGSRLFAEGFVELGGTYTMVLDDAAALGAATVPAGAQLERLSTTQHRRQEVIRGAAHVMAEAFAGQAGETELIADLARTPARQWDACLISMGPEPVAAGRRYTADGITYLSSIATRPGWWGRGFGAAITASLALDGLAAGGEIVHLGAESENIRALEVYRRLGFAVLGDRLVELLLA